MQRLEDALLDLTNRGDVVIDPFLASGSALIAAHQAAMGARAVLVETGELFNALAARKAGEQVSN